VVISFRRSNAPSLDREQLEKQLSGALRQLANAEVELGDMGRVMARMSVAFDRQAHELAACVERESALAADNQELTDTIDGLHGELVAALTENGLLQARLDARAAAADATAHRMALRTHPAVQAIVDSGEALTLTGIRQRVPGTTILEVQTLVRDGIIERVSPRSGSSEPRYRATEVTALAMRVGGGRVGLLPAGRTLGVAAS